MAQLGSIPLCVELFSIYMHTMDTLFHHPLIYMLGDSTLTIVTMWLAACVVVWMNILATCSGGTLPLASVSWDPAPCDVISTQIMKSDFNMVMVHINLRCI